MFYLALSQKIWRKSTRTGENPSPGLIPQASVFRASDSDGKKYGKSSMMPCGGTES